MHVYKAIAAVTADLAKEGISKSRRNQQQGYSFRGIDDVYNALSPVLSEHGLCILPRVLARECVERTTTKGGALFYVTVEVEFDFIAAQDGSKHTVKTFGEAMDSADKATNKAMSAAYKYAAMQAFCIPVEGDNDADATTHEVAPREKPQDAGPKAPPRDMDSDCEHISKLVRGVRSLEELADLWRSAFVQSFIKQAPKALADQVSAEKDARKAALSMPVEEAA